MVANNTLLPDTLINQVLYGNHDGITTGKELIQEYTINLLSDTSQLRKGC